MKTIGELLAADALKSLAVIVSCGWGDDPFDIYGALRLCRSLEELTINLSEDSEPVSNNMLATIPDMLLNVKDTIQVLDLKGFDVSSSIVSQIARAAAGSKSLATFALGQDNQLEEYSADAIADMIRTCPALRKLEFTSNISHQFCPPASARNIVRAIKERTATLEELLLCNMVDDECAQDIAAAVSASTTLKVLSLDNYRRFTDVGTNLLTAALRCNRSVSEVKMTYHCGSHAHDGTGVGALVDEPAICMAQMLIVNETIQVFEVHGNFGERALKEFIRCLPAMSTIKKLMLDRIYYVDGGRWTLPLLHELANALQNHYTALEDFLVWFCTGEAYESGLHSQIRYLLSLNRGGRRILNSPNVPLGLWPLVLCRDECNEDAIFYILRESPEIFLREKPEIDVDRTTTVSGKRKRDD